MTHAHREPGPGGPTRQFLSAFGHDWALPLYDPITRLLGAARERRALIERAGIAAGHKVLDLGCATGTLLVELARMRPGVELVGVDPDPKALARARRKAAAAGAQVQLERGFADALPFATASFDRVLSSFVFHHIPVAQRLAGLREVARVLVPGGTLHFVDFTPSDPDGPWQLFRMFHDTLEDNGDAAMLDLLGRAGFVDARVDARTSTRIFSLSSFCATVPHRAV